MSVDERRALSEGLLAAPLWRDEAEAYRREVTRDVLEIVVPLVGGAEAARRFPVEVLRGLGARGHLARRWRRAGPFGDLGSGMILSNEMGKALSGGISAGVSLHLDSAMSVLRSGSGHGATAATFDAAARGDAVLCIAVTEPASGSDLSRISTRAVQQADGSWRIDGSKKFISLARSADHALVLARTGDGEYHLTFFIVPSGPDGYRVVRDLPKHGTHSVETCELELDGVVVPADHAVGRIGMGLALFSRAMTTERLSLCAQLVGALEAVLELVRAYLRARAARNGRLWDFQALRHRFADLLAEQRMLDAAVLATGWRLQFGQATQRDLAALKLYVAPRVEAALSEAMQLLGGAGYLQELPVERALRDARLARIGAGTDDVMRELVAEIALPEDRIQAYAHTIERGAPRATSDSRQEGP